MTRSHASSPTVPRLGSLVPPRPRAGLFHRFCRCGRAYGSDEQGAELVEFAFASGIFFIFIFGFIELCVVLFMYNTAAEAARETTRWASVRGTTCSNPNISSCPATLAQVQAYGATLPGASTMNVQVWWCQPDGQTGCVQDASHAAQGNVVKVKVSYAFATIPYVSKSALTVASTSESVMWQ